MVNHFLALAEAKVNVATAKAEKMALDQIEDLEAMETPENLMLRTVSGQDNKDRTDREVVMPCFKFLWETFRTVLDVLRNNNKLESLYQVRCLSRHSSHITSDYTLTFDCTIVLPCSPSLSVSPSPLLSDPRIDRRPPCLPVLPKAQPQDGTPSIV